MSVTKQEIIKELQQFAQRKLETGEVVLLAYVIANKLPLLPTDVDNVNQFVLGHGVLLERISIRINEYASIDSDQFADLKDLVGKFLLWRTSIANGNCSVLFGGDENMVIDDLSGLPRVVDLGTLCSLSSISTTANWLLSTFKKLVCFEQDLLRQEIKNV